ncbi:U2 small nuclear ribonucleoprotein A' [Strongyloides ratti]|uniref:U2 small nuclear ribonucleoprotein A n=1 Tax=Strongyloides ratti TaxID=34506 RepID=A0A090L5D1_STRRB|nr:U2 small nuclear ribonucleoprotein A' [Strongyloides ratti]CEF63307.1 U2 small nuclear ribonucleoprotein A' [Strongyloides ratti]
MVRLNEDLIFNGFSRINPCRQRELQLRRMTITELADLGCTKDAYDCIDFSINSIVKLENFPRLNNLKTLILHDNRVKYIADDIGEKLPNLEVLMLTNNLLAELGDINPLAKCKKLRVLHLMGNPCSYKKNYKLYLIYKIRSLRVLDCKIIRQKDRVEADKLFKGKKNLVNIKEFVQYSSAVQNMEEKINIDVQLQRFPKEVEEQLRLSLKNAKTLAELEAIEKSLTL